MLLTPGEGVSKDKDLSEIWPFNWSFTIPKSAGRHIISIVVYLWYLYKAVIQKYLAPRLFDLSKAFV